MPVFRIKKWLRCLAEESSRTTCSGRSRKRRQQKSLMSMPAEICEQRLMLTAPEFALPAYEFDVPIDAYGEEISRDPQILL